MFGSKSSPGIFCDLFGLFVDCITNMSQIENNQVLQHLDDVLAVGLNRIDSPVHEFHRRFLEEAFDVGFRPDVSNNRETNLEPMNSVVSLEIKYDINWTWTYSEERLSVIINTLWRLENREKLTKTEIQCSQFLSQRREIQQERNVQEL